MFAIFKKGLVFGVGFAISFLVVIYIGATIILQPYMANPEGASVLSLKTKPINSVNDIDNLNQGKKFHELELDQQIEQASVIALATFKKDPSGRVKAILTEFLKKDPNTIFYYKIGDEYQRSSYNPGERKHFSDGAVIFFTGSPATMKMSMTYSGDRIRGLGDIPIELLKNKCKKNNA